MDIFTLLIKTILFRPYVFFFLATFLFSAIQLIGWPRTWRFLLISWTTAFVCEVSSTRNGIPFGEYIYNGSTMGQELYFFNVPFMVPISFSFLLYAAYCVVLCLFLPIDRSSPSTQHLLKPLRFDIAARTSWPVLLITACLFALIDMVIDPVALRGDRWFLGKIYHYTDPGIHFGVPLTNYAGWSSSDSSPSPSTFRSSDGSPHSRRLHRSHPTYCWASVSIMVSWPSISAWRFGSANCSWE